MDIVGIIAAIINLVFAIVNFYKVNKLYKNPSDPDAIKNLKDIREFSKTTILIFSFTLIGVIIAAAGGKKNGGVTVPMVKV